MGQYLSGQMKRAMAENQQAMIAQQKEIQIKQIQTVKALQLAMGKEMFAWYSAFLIFVFPGLIAQTIKQKNKAYIAPLVPLSFIWLYQYDLYYGTKLDRIRKEARRILDEEPDKLQQP